MAVPPRSVASSGARAPPIFPNGVRAAPGGPGPRGRVAPGGAGAPPIFPNGAGAAPGIPVLGFPDPYRRFEIRMPASVALINVTARSGDAAATAADTRVVPLFEGEG